MDVNKLIKSLPQLRGPTGAGLELSVRSQRLYMTGLSVAPQWNARHAHFALTQEQLTLTVNAIEAKLGEHGGGNFRDCDESFQRLRILCCQCISLCKIFI